MIDRTTKNIKKVLKYFGGNTAKISTTKKILYKVLEGILTAKILNIKIFYLFIYLFLSFLYVKELIIKMDLISVEGSEIVGLGVKSISDLVLKEIHSICEKKINKTRN